MSERIFSKQMPNGLRIIGKRIPWSHTVAVGLWVTVGAQDDAQGREGLSHFVEHNLFKGTKRHTALQIARLIDSIGGNVDAFTEKEMTCFFFRVLPQHLSKGLSLIHELITQPTFRLKSIEVERGVVLAEIQNVEDTAEDLVGELFFKALWNGHPLSQPILGTKDSVRKFNRKMLENFLNDHYIPEHMIISAAGILEPDDFCETVEVLFSGLKGSRNTIDHIPPPVSKPTLYVANRPTEQLYFCVGVQGFAANQMLTYPTALLDIIIGGGASSRLFMEVREKLGLAYSIGSSCSYFKTAGIFCIHGSCTVKDAEKTMQVIGRELKRIKRNGLKDGELELAKTQLKLNIIMSQETIIGTMLGLGRQLYYFGRSIPIKEIIQRIDQTTEDEVLEIAGQLFNGNNFAASFVGPLSEKEGKKILSILNEV